MAKPTRIDIPAAARRVQVMSERYGMPSDSWPVGEPPVPDLDSEIAEGAEVALAARWQACIPRRFQLAKWSALQASQLHDPDLESLRAWAEPPCERNLVIQGTVGTGKSYAAAAAVRPLHKEGHKIRFLPVEEMLDELRPGGPERALAALASVDVLVVDDVGAERPTDWTAERFYAVVNRRWLEQLPTVFTTNLIPKELGEHVGQRAYSRMTGGAVRVTMIGPDRRKS
jgi:hypothetical protein